jgi:hypothetical protein
MTQSERGGLDRGSAGSGSTLMYFQRSIPGRFVPVRARRVSSATVIPSSATNRMHVHHIAIDTSQGLAARPAVLP